MSRSIFLGGALVSGARASLSTTYRLCDLALESNIAFDELAPAGSCAPDLSFQFERRETPELRSSTGLLRSRSRNGRVWLDVGDLGGEYLLRFPGLAEFVVSADGRTIHGFGSERIPLRSIRHLVLDQVLPVVLSQHVPLVLHAGAIATPCGAVAFLGGSGSGKSTLTGSLAAAGWPLLTDDFLVLRGDPEALEAVPSYPGLRLWTDSASELFGSGEAVDAMARFARKRRWGAGRRPLPFALGAVPLARIYVLPERRAQASESVAIEPLAARASFAELSRHSYRLDIAQRTFMGHHFESLTRLAAQTIVRRLSYPLSYACLPDVRRAILNDLGASGRST